jgi:hypothetical protein
MYQRACAASQKSQDYSTQGEHSRRLHFIAVLWLRRVQHCDKDLPVDKSTTSYYTNTCPNVQHCFFSDDAQPCHQMFQES